MINLDTGLLNFNLQEIFDKNKDKLQSCKEDILKRQSDKSDWLGWTLLHEQNKVFADIQEYSQDIIKSNKYDNIIILGIGGSALGPQCLIKALFPPTWNELSTEQRNGGLKTYFIDNVDPDWADSIFSHLDIKRTLVCTITKSGGTAETISAFLYALDKLQKELPDSWKDNLIAITDPEKSKLRDFVNDTGITSFPIESNVGGRFSVFSPVGLLPLALMGCDISKFKLALTQAYNDTLGESAPLDNIANKLALSLVHFDLEQKRNINILMPYSSHLANIADWYVQLVAESLGKQRDRGVTPIKAVGATDQHSQVQLFVEGPLDKFAFFIKVKNFRTDFDLPTQEVKGFENLAGESLKRLIQAEGTATAQALSKSDTPSLSLELDSISPESVAYLLYTFELMTAVAGYLYNIDPFNQPGVELGKKYTYALLGKVGFEEYLKDIT